MNWRKVRNYGITFVSGALGALSVWMWWFAVIDLGQMKMEEQEVKEVFYRRPDEVIYSAMAKAIEDNGE